MGSGRRAVVVATDRYEDPGLNALSAPQSDASALAEVLGDEDLGGFDVEVLINVPQRPLAERLEEVLLESGPEECLLLHFACHGLKNDRGSLFLAATDTRVRLLNSTALAASWINALMQDSRARQIGLLLDCCFGGAFARGLVHRSAPATVHAEDHFGGLDAAGGRGRTVMTASGAMEYAFEGGSLASAPGVHASAFTAAIVDGLRTGRADVDRDGNVSLDELYKFVYGAVQAVTPQQCPEYTTFGQRGPFVVARSHLRRIEPRPIPPHLERVLDGGDATSRRGAVLELIDLAKGDDVAVALSAVERLKALQEDDSHKVEVMARAAVEELMPRLGSPQIPSPRDAPEHPHAGPTPVVIPILGYPVARYGEARVDHPDARAAVRDGQIRVRVRGGTSSPEQLTVTFEGALGDLQSVVPLDPAATAARSESETVPQPRTPAPEKAVHHPPAQATTSAPASELSPEDVENQRFSTVRLREGYDMEQVDACLDEISVDLRRRLDYLHTAGQPKPQGLMTADDVANRRFTAVKLREGYDMAEVDQFLDRVEREFTRLDGYIG